jgi:hypothetical protein
VGSRTIPYRIGTNRFQSKESPQSPQPSTDRPQKPGWIRSLKQTTLDRSIQGAFSSGGTRAFCAWYQGPPTSTFTNRFGIPELLYKVRVSGPQGEVDTFGPYGFSKPGFGVQFLNLAQTGTWRVDWYTVHRETQEERLVQSTRFQLIP